ncbi:MAG: hypothetical protein ACD_10C00143G0002 [uncultured bacterium]|nr:MAG: hypothetical protein ACD_10C00143G0002 [uncultured bacterium]
MFFLEQRLGIGDGALGFVTVVKGHQLQRTAVDATVFVQLCEIGQNGFSHIDAIGTVRSREWR